MSSPIQASGNPHVKQGDILEITDKGGRRYLIKGDRAFVNFTYDVIGNQGVQADFNNQGNPRVCSGGLWIVGEPGYKFKLVEPSQAPPEAESAAGMSLRDQFAVSADLSKDLEEDGCIDQHTALSLMDGTAPPEWYDDHLNARRWWAEAESRLRYLKADTMLKVRNVIQP